MHKFRASVGHTLLELSFVLALLGILFALAAPALMHAGDVLAVRAAREAIASSAARTRLFAVQRGGARLVVDLPTASLWIEAPAGVAVSAPAELGRDHRVILETTPAGVTRANIDYDGLGIGRLASRTLRIQRQGVEAYVTFSAYGRVRQW